MIFYKVKVYVEDSKTWVVVSNHKSRSGAMAYIERHIADGKLRTIDEDYLWD